MEDDLETNCVTQTETVQHQGTSKKRKGSWFVKTHQNDRTDSTRRNTKFLRGFLEGSRPAKTKSRVCSMISARAPPSNWTRTNKQPCFIQGFWKASGVTLCCPLSELATTGLEQSRERASKISILKLSAICGSPRICGWILVGMATTLTLMDPQQSQ